MRILIFGSGAVGSAIAARLHLKGYDVHIVGREQHIQKIKDEGLKVKGIWGEFVVRDIKAYTEIPKEQKFDAVLITVKTFSNQDAVNSIISSKIKADIFISMQNGLGNYEFFSQYLHPVGSARVIFGIVFEKPGEIEITVWGGPILFGFWDTKFYKEENKAVKIMKNISDIFSDSGLPSEFVEDIRTPIWEKALYNSALNPLSVILNTTYGNIILNPFTREISREIISEGISISQKEGANVKDDFFDKFEKRLVPPTKDHISSMIQDIKIRGKTEIDSMCGAIVKYGIKHNIKAKVNFTMWNLIKALEKNTKKIE